VLVRLLLVCSWSIQLHEIFTQCKGLDGRRVSLTRAIGAGGVGGSFDRGGYMVQPLSVISLDPLSLRYPSIHSECHMLVLVWAPLGGYRCSPPTTSMDQMGCCSLRAGRFSDSRDSRL
jgi:hypothetical protein